MEILSVPHQPACLPQRNLHSCFSECQNYTNYPSHSDTDSLRNPRFPSCPPDTLAGKPLIALVTSTQGSIWGVKCASVALSGHTGTRNDGIKNRETRTQLSARSKPPPSPVLLGVAGRLDDLRVSGITDRPPSSLLRFIGSQTGDSAALTQILSAGRQIREAAGRLRLVSSRHGHSRKGSGSS